MKKMLGLIASNFQYGDYGLLNRERPIASIPFGGRYRLVDFPLSNMVNSGINVVGLITPYMYRSLLDHVGNGKAFNLSRKLGGLYVLPGSVYGLRSNNYGKMLLKDIKINKEFLYRTTKELICITSSNKIYNLDFREIRDFHEANNAAITLAYKKVNPGDVSSPMSNYNLILDGSNKVVDINNDFSKEANQSLDAIIMNIDLLKKILEWYNHQTYMDLMEIIKELLPNIPTYAYEFTGYVHNIDNITDYMHASMELLNTKVIKELFNSTRPILTKVQDAPPVKFEKKSKVSESIIATGSIIQGEVNKSIVSRNVVIEEGAKVKNCVILQHAYIKKGAVLENVILDKHAHIKEGCLLKGTGERPLVITREQYK